MSLFYLYRFKFAVKLQIILFENAIIGHFATRAVSGQFWPVVLALLLGGNPRNPLGHNLGHRIDNRTRSLTRAETCPIFYTAHARAKQV